MFFFNSDRKKMAGLFGAVSLREYLAGSWQLRRTVTARDGTVLGRVRVATATFSESGGERLLYRECGAALLGAAKTPLQFEREYMYAFTGPTTADVSFHSSRAPRGSRSGSDAEAAVDDENGFFHSLSVEPDTGVGATTEHLCIDDLYTASIELARRDAFTWRWTVVGPAKDYTIESQFMRDAASSAAVLSSPQKTGR